MAVWAFIGHLKLEAHPAIMIPKKKNKEKDIRPNPASGTDSKLASIARSFQRRVQFLKSSDSKVNTEKQNEGSNPEGSIHVDPRHQSPSTATSVVLSSDPSAHSSAVSTPLPSQNQHTGLSSTNVPGAQAIRMTNYGSHNRLLLGDDNRDNKGIIVTGGSVQFYHNSQAGERSAPLSTKHDYTVTALIYIEATQQVLSSLFGIVNTNSHAESQKNGSEGKVVKGNFIRLVDAVKSLMERDNDPSIRQLRDYLGDFWSELSRVHEQSFNNDFDIEVLSRDVTWKVRLFLFVIHMGGYISHAIVVEGVKKRVAAVQRNAESAAPCQLIKDLPHAKAAYDDYVLSHQRRVSCFEGTRQALLEEVGGWVAKSETGIFVLFGLAGIGKSTIAQTIAERADDVRLLAASFFFSRDEAERRTAEKFFTTIAFQLCLRDPEFATAIEGVLMTKQGKDAISKLPLEQLETLILEPLRKLEPRKVVVVVDALDECDEEDAPMILMGLNKLVQGLPLFKVVLTTRPQHHLQLFQTTQAFQKVFHLHDIEDKIVDGDIELYLRHKLSLEEVKARLPNLRKPWAASDDEIRLLVRAAGRLFIIASTAVLFILDKTSTPAYRMKVLRTALDQDHTPFNTLNNFYTTILRNAVPQGCERDTVDRYQTVIGAIILIQEPLAVSALATLANTEVDDIIAVLGNLQPVILLGDNDIPVVYHKSFPDYIQDPTRCTDEDLRIDSMFHHTQMAKHCLRLLNLNLKQNILDLGDPARFMDNGKALEKQGLAEDHVQEKIPSESQYACSYFANHIRSTDEDTALVEELGRFINGRLLNWLEALSWINKLDSAHRTLLMVKKQLKPTSLDLLHLVADVLRFIGKFYILIRRSALHTYHSALPFTPTETSIYTRFSKQMTFCQVQGGQTRWDGIIATVNSGSKNNLKRIIFSPNGTTFACCMHDQLNLDGLMTLHDAVSGIPFARIKGLIFAITHNFSKAAAFVDGLIMLYNVEGVTPIATIKPSATVINLALSPDGSRLVAALNNDTIGLWDTEKCEQIKSFNRWEKESGATFSSGGSRTAFASCDEVVRLLDGISGNIVVDLKFPRLEWSRSMYDSWDLSERWEITFSGDGSRFACLAIREWKSTDYEVKVESTLKVWNARDGILIGTAKDVGDIMVFSTDGSLIATGIQETVKLWNGNDFVLLKTLDLDFSIESLAIQSDRLGVASWLGHLVTLHDINSYRCVARLPFSYPTALAFSPDNTCLAAGNTSGEVRLWDVPSVTTSDTTSREQSSIPINLAFSPDCSRLASRDLDGTIKLWDTSNMTQVTVGKCHSKWDTSLAFSIEGGKFASGSEDGTIMWWNKDGVLSGALKCSGGVRVVTLSSSMLAAATQTRITLWDLETHFAITTLDQPDANLLAFSHCHSLLAAATESTSQIPQSSLTLWDVGKQTLVFAINLDDGVSRMRFLSGDSQLAMRCRNYSFHLFNPHDCRLSEVSENQAISWLGLCPNWHGIPVWTYGEDVVGRFSQQEKAVAVLTYPSDLRVRTTVDGSSMMALGCEDGHILLIKAV